MGLKKIKSYAKINLALNVTGKRSSLHKIESIISFVDLYDDILIKKINFKKHDISFHGKFSKNITKKNTVTKLLKVLEKKKLLVNKKFQIKIYKRIPSRAGLGGGSMNAANILKYFLKEKIVRTSKKQIIEVCKSIGSDVILGLNSTNTILTEKNVMIYFKNCKKIYALIVKPNFGCSTKYIYSKVKKFQYSKFNKPRKGMFDLDYLKKMDNSLESIAFIRYPKLKKLKLFLDNLSGTVFARMTGSGSALVAYFHSKKICERAEKHFRKKYKNYWSIVSKTI